VTGRTLETTLARTLSAPRERVWRAWTEPARMAAWWGPKGFTNPVCEMDVRPGGRLRILMRAPDGSDHPMSGTFREVVPPERLVFEASPEDGQGVAYARTVTTVALADTADGGTLLTVHTVMTELMDLGPGIGQEMEQGWSQSLAKLAERLEAGE
jgi:uncharacterized protein YndB with AHSA1/START domain